MNRVIPSSAASQTDLPLATAVLMITSFVPAAVFYLAGTASHAPGVVAASCVLALIYGIAPEQSRRGLTLERWIVVVVFVVLVLAIHLLIASLFHDTALGRAMLSLLVLAALLSGAFMVSAILNRVSDASLERALAFIRIVFVVFAALSVLGIQLVAVSQYVSSEKSVFPFAEPSHFAIAFSPLLFHACLVNRGWRQIFWLIVGFAIAYLLRNLSLVVATGAAALVCLPISRLLPAGLALVAAMGLLDIDYFTDRLDLTAQTQNLSTLIYRQGWELVLDAVQRTGGWGIGFQQLGFVPFDSPSANVLFRILRSDSNILDGGFVAAKLLSELGAIGLALILAYIYLGARLGWKLRRSIASGTSLPPKLVFSGAVVCGYSIELFVRGLGYFSGSALLLIAAILMMRNVTRYSRPMDDAHAGARR